MIAVGGLVAAVVFLIGSAEPPAGGEAEFGSRTGQDNDRFVVDGESLGLGDAYRDANLIAASPREYFRGEACTGGALTVDTDTCSPAGTGFDGCPAGMTATPPLWMRTQLADGTWGPWEIVTWYTCPSEADLFAAIEREWTELRPEPTQVSLQPDTGRVYATVPTVAIADDSVRLHMATILGAAVTIRATPSRYQWAWGDGESTTTTDPGAPYPNATVTHAYGRAMDGATVTLTTTWTGEYRIGAGGWADFDTTIESASPGISLEVLHPRARLVDSTGG